MIRFTGQDHHVVWLEPEGYDSGQFLRDHFPVLEIMAPTSQDVIYPNGISCTMPADIQERMLRTIPGLEDVEMIRPGYGVEYDCIDARELKCMTIQYANRVS